MLHPLLQYSIHVGLTPAKSLYPTHPQAYELKALFMGGTQTLVVH